MRHVSICFNRACVKVKPHRRAFTGRVGLSLLLVVVALLVSLTAKGSLAGEKLSPERKVRQIEVYVVTAQYDPIRYEFGLLISENWRKLGFDVKVTPLEWSRMVQNCVKEHDFDVFTLNWGGRPDRIDPNAFLYEIYHSSQSRKGAYNLAGYHNPEYDKWAELQQTTLDPAKRREAVLKCQEILAQDAPQIPICTRDQLMPCNIADWSGWTPMMGEGLGAFWNFMNVKPKTDRKVLRWGYPSEVPSLNPVAAVDRHSFQVLRLLYDKLVRVNVNGEPKNWAAEKIEEIDSTTIDVTIRQGMKFHDGRPVTTEDVKFSFDYLKDVESAYYMGLIKPIKSIEIIGQRTLRFKLDKPYAPFIANTLGQVYLLPKHIWEKIPESVGLSKAQDYTNERPIGSGPFKMAYWRRNEEMKMVRFEEYFSRPHIEGIIKIPYADDQGMVAGVETGECDFAGWFVQPIQVERLKGQKNIKVISVGDHGHYVMVLNNRRKPFDDLAVRRALSHATPKKLIVDRLLEGYGQVVHSVIAPSNEFWHNPQVMEYPFDMQQAKKKLAEAGYAWDAEGQIYYPEGKSNQ